MIREEIKGFITASGADFEQVSDAVWGFAEPNFEEYQSSKVQADYMEARGFAVDGYAGFNAVRARAGLPAIATPTLRNILDERGRELYQECWRRNDLIRFGLFTSSDYVWQWKGDVREGRGVDAGRELFPIPDADLLANSKLEQNDYYKSAK